MKITALWNRVLVGALLIGALSSCSKENGPQSILGPGPEPGPPTPSEAEGYFVNAAIGHDDSAGTRTAPFKTIRRAIEAARPTGVDVFVAQGSYLETTPGRPLALRSKVSLFGGYDGATWQRDPARFVSEIVGTAEYPTVDCTHTDSLALDGFTIRSPDQTTPGVSSICVRVAGRSSGVVISNNVLFAGKGADGANGQVTEIGVGALGGGHGGTLTACPILGGGGGASASGWHGGDGGDGSAYEGKAGEFAAGSDATYGKGGAGGTFLSPDGKPGTAGRSGQPGSHGQAGDSVGVLTSVGYVPSNGTTGTAGTAGRGGGGGGSAHGSVVSCGAQGGGGGGGGNGGGPGTGGGGGAGSFGILVNGLCVVDIINNRITTRGGGRGGAAGEGSAGHGSPGGFGGKPDSYPLFAKGGDGGAGGAGGSGGHGGPGGGGPSIGIAEGPLDTTTRIGNVITLGTAGSGGTTEAAGRPSAPAGIAREYRKFGT